MSLKCDMFFFWSLYNTAKPQADGDAGRGHVPPVSQPRLRSDELPAPLLGGDKQYGRFRDTIFLNYWAIVFVQDVVFYVLFLHSVVFTSFVCVLFFVRTVRLSFFFHCRIFLSFLVLLKEVNVFFKVLKTMYL